LEGIAATPGHDSLQVLLKMNRTIIQVSIILLYFLVLLFLLLISTGVGIRIGGNMYAESGFGPLRTSAIVLLFILLLAGLFVIWKVR